MKSNPISEKDIQHQILDWLKLKGIFAWRNNTGMASYGGHKARFVRFGAVGSPDIFALDGGKLYGIEVKGTKGVLSGEQRAFGRGFELAGGCYVVARDLQAVIDRIVGGRCDRQQAG